MTRETDWRKMKLSPDHYISGPVGKYGAYDVMSGGVPVTRFHSRAAAEAQFRRLYPGEAIHVYNDGKWEGGLPPGCVTWADIDKARAKEAKMKRKNPAASATKWEVRTLRGDKRLAAWLGGVRYRLSQNTDGTYNVYRDDNMGSPQEIVGKGHTYGLAAAKRVAAADAEKRALPPRKNPLAGPLTISHEGSSVVIRHTNMNPRGFTRKVWTFSVTYGKPSDAATAKRGLERYEGKAVIKGKDGFVAEFPSQFDAADAHKWLRTHGLHVDAVVERLVTKYAKKNPVVGRWMRTRHGYYKSTPTGETYHVTPHFLGGYWRVEVTPADGKTCLLKERVYGLDAAKAAVAAAAAKLGGGAKKNPRYASGPYAERIKLPKSVGRPRLIEAPAPRIRAAFGAVDHRAAIEKAIIHANAAARAYNHTMKAAIAKYGEPPHWTSGIGNEDFPAATQNLLRKQLTAFARAQDAVALHYKALGKRTPLHQSTYAKRLVTAGGYGLGSAR